MTSSKTWAMGLGGALVVAGAILMIPRRGVAAPAKPAQLGPFVLVGDSIGVGMSSRLRELIPGLTSRAVVGALTGRYARQLPSGPLGTVIVEGHINDLTEPAAWTISNLRTLFQSIRGRGGRVIAVTTTPWAGYSQWTSERARQRDLVNAWLLAGADGLVARTVDIRRVVADPNNPERLRPSYAAPDRLHLNTAGYRALAQFVARGTL